MRLSPLSIAVTDLRAPDHLPVRHRGHFEALLEEPIEAEAPSLRGASRAAERERIAGVGQRLWTDRPVVRAQDPAREPRGHAMHSRQDGVGWVVAAREVGHVVWVPLLGEAGLPAPPVSGDHRFPFDRLMHKREQAVGRDVGHTAHSDSADPVPVRLHRHDHDGRGEGFTPTDTARDSSHIGCIDLDATRTALPSGPTHGAPQRVTPCPRGLIAPQPEDALAPHGIHALRLTRDGPHRVEPCAQRFPSAREDRACRCSGLALAYRASELPPPGAPSRRRAAGGALDALGPANSLETVAAGLLGGQPLVKFDQRGWIINTRNGMRCHPAHP